MTSRKAEKARLDRPAGQALLQRGPGEDAADGREADQEAVPDVDVAVDAPAPARRRPR